ncbi:hypothetical protein J6590_073760 [Homalodisca vitripennis]|nr:hypothetical protein J6590_073760 [Homalodisca vitripennis]
MNFGPPIPLYTTHPSVSLLTDLLIKNQLVRSGNLAYLTWRFLKTLPQQIKTLQFNNILKRYRDNSIEKIIWLQHTRFVQKVSDLHSIFANGAILHHSGHCILQSSSHLLYKTTHALSGTSTS